MSVVMTVQSVSKAMTVQYTGARFEVFTAVTMKNAVFCDIKPHFVPPRDTSRVRYRAQPVNAM
jgi:hypothetical protein